jgi:paraquat-inducible protein A
MPDPVDASGLSDLPLEDLVACHECDLLMRKPKLAHGESPLPALRLRVVRPPP